jgi:hypothetical protein
MKVAREERRRLVAAGTGRVDVRQTSHERGNRKVDLNKIHRSIRMNLAHAAHVQGTRRNLRPNRTTAITSWRKNQRAHCSRPRRG